MSCGGCGGCPHRLGYHTDVSNTQPTEGQILCWHGNAGVWYPCDIEDLLGGLDLVESLNDLSDVNVLGATAGQCVCFDGTNWVPTSLLLGDLGDVSTVGATNGQYLCFNGTSWVPGTISPGGFIPHDLGEHDDVDTTGATNGQYLCFNGTTWVPGTIAAGGGPMALGDLTDVTAPTPNAGECLCWNGTAWVPTSTGGGAAHALTDHTDVNTAGASNGEYLCYNGTSWIAQAISAGGAAIAGGVVAPNGGGLGNASLSSGTGNVTASGTTLTTTHNYTWAAVVHQKDGIASDPSTGPTTALDWVIYPSGGTSFAVPPGPNGATSYAFTIIGV